LNLISPFLAASQKWEKIYSDSLAVSITKVTVDNKNYIGFMKELYFILLDANCDTMIKKQDYYHQFEFKDFDLDGHLDVFLYLASNTPSVIDLYLYEPSSKKFKLIQNSSEYPAPEKIRGTKYYYSYHKSGCADLNWDSDLFYIHNFKVVRIGNISGIGCSDKFGKKDGIYISVIRKDKKNLIKTLPIDTIGKFKDYKWGFIKDYWTKNYKNFL
jgi:hypothetical protein